jgi:hypothetical protein
MGYGNPYHDVVGPMSGFSDHELVPYHPQAINSVQSPNLYDANNTGRFTRDPNNGMVNSAPQPSTNQNSYNSSFYLSPERNISNSNQYTDYNQTNNLYDNPFSEENPFDPSPNAAPSILLSPSSPCAHNYYNPNSNIELNVQPPPTMPSLLPTPSSPNSCMTSLFTFQSDTDQEDNVINQEANTVDIVKMLVNLDDMFQESSGQQKPSRGNNKDNNKISKPLPKSNGLVGSSATLNDVKAILSSNVMPTQYEQQQQLLLLQPPKVQYSQLSSSVHSNYMGYDSFTSLSSQNIYGSHNMMHHQQQPYHPLYYQSQPSY